MSRELKNACRAKCGAAGLQSCSREDEEGRRILREARLGQSKTISKKQTKLNQKIGTINKVRQSLEY